MATGAILVAYGTKSGATAGIAETIGSVLRSEGFTVEVRPAASVRHVGDYAAVVLGGGLYARRWHRDARRFARRHAKALRGVPVWLFSSGPLDHSAETADIPPVPSAAAAATLLGARGQVTFGGKLGPDARGWIARKMAQGGRGGDFRDTAQIRTWATTVAAALSSSAGRP
jgi:menaquinone-dependent protoporphyrinogen oxidase